MIRPYARPYVTDKALSLKTVNERAFFVLISTVISLRTKDGVTASATERLFSLAKTPGQMCRLDVKKIEKAIYPAGFYRVKAKNIRQICQILSDRCVGSNGSVISIPSTIEELTQLPGVGRKTANLVLTEGLHKPGICVDTHVHRILNRVGFIITKEPNETEMVLRNALPRKFWRRINYSLVMFGQNVCKPVGPKCSVCLLKKKCKYGRLSLRGTSVTKQSRT
jgi:endonuclease-3